MGLRIHKCRGYTVVKVKVTLCFLYFFGLKCGPTWNIYTYTLYRMYSYYGLFSFLHHNEIISKNSNKFFFYYALYIYFLAQNRWIL